MRAPEEYPRVLIVYLSCINEADQHGVSIRNWFAEWPRDRLAQIYSGNERGEQRFCGHNFRLGPSERRWGEVFFRLKGSALGESSRPSIFDQGSETDLQQPKTAARLRYGVSDLLLNSGLWELVFRPKLSPRLLGWIDAFRPQVIYCQGYNLAFSWLPVMLKAHYGLPICFQTGDDWPMYLYADSVIAPAIRPVVDDAVSRLIGSAEVRFANGPNMAGEYERRYGLTFEHLMMADDPERFRRAPSQRVAATRQVSVVYTGGLAHGRWVSIIDLCSAAMELRQEGLDVLVTAFASVVPPEAVGVLQSTPNLHVLPSAAHEDVPSILKGADILFLPETFDPTEAQSIRFSISTKAHLYMMSGRPILVYGSPIAGVVDYATSEGWAYVVDRRSTSALATAIRGLMEDAELRRQLESRGMEVALKNHDERLARAKLLSALQMWH